MSSSRPHRLALLAAIAVALPAAPAFAAPPEADYLERLEPPAATPATIDGKPEDPLLRKGERLGRGQSLLRVRVSGGANQGIQLKLTCPTGTKVRGYGYDGPDGLAVNGRPLLDRRVVRPKVQAAFDVNEDGRFTGIVLALCDR